MIHRTLALETVQKIGERVVLKGWVNARRNMGKVAFVDLRDRSGIVQVVLVPSELDEASKAFLEGLRSEFVVEIEGIVQARGNKQVNPNMETGTVEMLAKSVVILNSSETTPFEVDKDTRGVTEDSRLAYRYLDLRTERMQKNIRRRSEVFQFMRQFLSKEMFTEIETPILTKGTPEGAREFLVPSRVHEGKMYVLPQSPQQFKQLLMVSGVERYFQFAKCFRDEDQRGDRQPEFTQLDMEMSFVEREDVMDVIERLLVETVSVLYPEKRFQETPFPHITYREAMEKYATDRPDIRDDKNDPNLLAFCWVVDFPFFEKTEEGDWTFTHNPFSAALPEYREALMNKENVGGILTSQYDVVLNGFEIGGGSIRNHRPDALYKVFEIMGFTGEEIEAQFGHILRAFSFGAPPHGGLALGMDRIMAILQNEPNIREVIAFPKDGHARDLMMDAPSVLPDKALRDVHIQIRKD